MCFFSFSGCCLPCSLFDGFDRLPGRVERRHKKRAYLVWVALVGFLIAYTVWIVVVAVKKQENPSISLTLEVKVKQDIRP